MISYKKRYAVLKFIGLSLTAIFAIWWFSPNRIAHNFSGYWHIIDYITFLLLSYVVWQQIISQLLMWSITGKMRPVVHYESQADLKVAFITTFVPNSEPIELLHNILPAMKNADYKHDVWLLDEGNDSAAQLVCEQYGVRYFSRKGIAKYNTNGGIFAAKTKGGNHNAWYDSVGYTYDIVAQIDTDFIPKKTF